MRILILTTLVFALNSCGGGSAESAYEAILAKEDSLAVASAKLPVGEILPKETSEQLIALLEEFVKNYPDDEHAPECLDKIHMAYTGLQDYQSAAQYAERILKDYPEYVNRAMVLESQASNYDMFILPRDTSKVRFYYTELLKEDIPKAKKKDIKNRLKHLDLTLEQYIIAQ